MTKLPIKGSSTWYLIWAVTFFGNIIVLLSSRLLLGLTITAQNVLGFSILSFFIALFILPGYFGWRLFALGNIVGNIAAIGYLLSQVLGRSTYDGWIDLTSIFGFLTLIVLGLITGLIAQFIAFLQSRRK